jgi:uncharacterized membrane protein YhiD involved in acid resistance
MDISPLTENIIKIGFAVLIGGIIGAGELIFVAASALIVIIVLLVFPGLEVWIDRIRESRTYKIVVSTANVEKIDKINEALVAHDLTVYEHHQSKTGNTIVGTWHTIGSPKHHEIFALLMVKDKDIEDFVY